MMKVRGDDELLELLEVMSGAHDESDPAAGGSDGDPMSPPKKPSGASPAEAAGASEDACVPETGWNGSIWNPHVFETTAPAADAASGAGERAMRLVSPQEEVLRQQAVAVVFSRFQVLGKELGVRLKNEMFERWQFSRKLKEGRGGDPILPAESFFDPGLDAELQGLGVHKSQSRNLCCELGRASKSALKTLKKQLRGVVSTPAAGGGGTVAGRGRGGSSSKGVSVKRVDESTFVLQLGKNKLRMNSAHYDKMKELFRRACIQGSAKNSPPSSTANAAAVGRKAAPSDWIDAFHDCLFACLMRYEALQGGGFQASMGGDAFDVLLKLLGVKMECFASPFNCRYSRYCSAFADTDKPFGSVGSFFDFRPAEGAFEANPPFVRDVILKMAKHMEDLLQATPKALTFVVIIPCWEDSAGWIRLRDSAFLSKHFKLDQKDHGYCEGKQHLRRNRYRLASFHTSVFFLQTEAARHQQGPRTLQQACQELQRAFALRQEADGSGGGECGGGDAGERFPEDGLSSPSASPSSSSNSEPHMGDGGDGSDDERAEREGGRQAEGEVAEEDKEEGGKREGALADPDDVRVASAGGGGAGRKEKKRKGGKGDRRRGGVGGVETGAELPPADDTQGRGMGSEEGSCPARVVGEVAASSTSTKDKKKTKKRKAMMAAVEEESMDEAKGSGGAGSGVIIRNSGTKASAGSAGSSLSVAASAGEAAGTKKRKKKRGKAAGTKALPAP